ncbi:MAG TPA: hypothetical protein VIV57_01170, partial [Anaeromyxobacter sp.]
VPDEVMVAYTRHLFDRAPKPMKVRKGMPGYSQAWRGELRQLAGAPEIRFFAEMMAAHGEGEDAVAETIRWLRGHPDGQEAWRMMQPSVEAVLHPEAKRLAGEAATAEESDRYRQEWVRTFADRLRDKTRGDQTLLGVIREGELRQSLDTYLATRYGTSLPERTQLLVEQAKSLAAAGKQAVTMVIGNSPEIHASLFAAGYSLPSIIANEFSEATGPVHVGALAGLALVLFGITITLNAAARVLVGVVKSGRGRAA